MADTIATGPIERQIIRDNRLTPKSTVKERSFTERIGERREQFVDTADDLLKWLQATTDEKKREELETLGPWIRTFAKVDGWMKKNFPEDKAIARLDTLLDLYQKAWTIPEEITRYAAGLWWVLSRKSRNEVNLSKRKKLAEAFLKDPNAYIEANRDIFDAVNLEQSFLINAGAMIINEGLFEPNVSDAHIYTTALEFTRDNTRYPANSVEFQSYVEIRNRVLDTKVSGRLNVADRSLILKHSKRIIAILLESVASRPHITLNEAIVALEIPNNQTIELFRIVRDARLKVEDLVGPYNTAYSLAYNFIRSQNLVEQFRKGDAVVNRDLIQNKYSELQTELGLNLPGEQVRSEIQYLMALYGQKKTNEEIDLLVQGHINRTGVNPIENLLSLAMNDYEILRWLISNPPGHLSIIANSLAAKRIIYPEASKINKLKITLMLQGITSAFDTVLADHNLIEDVQQSLNPPRIITNVEELKAAISDLRASYKTHMDSTDKVPAFDAKLKPFENVGNLSNLNVEVYSYFGLPPFATVIEIDAAVKPFELLRDVHAKVLDLNTGNLYPKYDELSDILGRLESASPGILDTLVSGGFFYYKHKDVAGLKKDLGKYKGKYYRDLNSLKGPKDQLISIPNPITGKREYGELNPINYVRHFLDLDYDPPQHGIKYYFDLIYRAARKAGLNQEVIDSLIVNKSTFLRVTTPTGGSAPANVAPDELTLLAMYVKGKNSVSEKYRELNEAVNAAIVLRDDASFKATYDAALIQAIEREESISSVDVERRIVAMRKDKSPAAYVGAPEEILGNMNVLSAYSVAAQLRLARVQALISPDNTNDLIDNVILARGDQTVNTLLQQVSMLGTTFLASPVNAQYFDDVLDLLVVSQSFRELLFGNQFNAELINLNSPVSVEILGICGLLNAPNSVKRRYLRGVKDTANTLRTQFFSRNNGLFGVGGDLTHLDPTRLYGFVYMMFGNPLDYVNGSESVQGRIRKLRSRFSALSYTEVLASGTPHSVNLRGILQSEMRSNDQKINSYTRNLNDLASPTGDIELRAAAVRDIRSNKRLIEIYGKGADARTLSILFANISLGEKLRRLETSEERFEAAYGDKLQ